ncbi:MAG: DUF971 domain-containing protein [Candidatus Poribacteria bacterium]|nr:DUF971 domain-containing protein [Candidatus Poribacteria bacterium]
MAHHPTEIKRLPTKLAIQWRDGLRSEYSYQLLRQECPCARCKASNRNPLRMLPADEVPGKLEIIDIQRVGRYAIRLIWNDGHKTGIYTFDFLRSLQPGPTEGPSG